MLGEVLVVVAAVAAGCFAYGVFVERDAYRLRRVTAAVLPAGAAPIRVLHLSDIHLVPGQRRKLAFLRSLREERPDLVVNTGDNIAHPGAVGPLVEALGPLLEVPGALVFGSNDYEPPRATNPLRYLLAPTRRHEPGSGGLPTEELRARLTAGGWRDVMHRRVVFDIAGQSVEVRGTDDAHHGRDRYEEVAGPVAEGVDLAVGVTHAPYLRLLDAMVGDGVDLLIAGHTHGGQVCVPGFGALTTNCDLDLRRAKGLSRHAVGERSAALHVSAGIGTSPTAPFRFACPPEATLLTLVGENPRPSAMGWTM